MRALRCLLGIHGPFGGRIGSTPRESHRWCLRCGARWHATYDGIEAGWSRERRDRG